MAPYVVRNIQEPPPPKEEMWLAIAEEVDKDEVQKRRRIREKRPIRDGGLEGLLGIRRMIQEEAQSVEMDQLENAMLTLRKLDHWKKQCGHTEGVLTVRVKGARVGPGGDGGAPHFSCKFPHKMALVQCPCAFFPVNFHTKCGP